MALKPPVMPLCQAIVRSPRRAWCQARPISPPGIGRRGVSVARIAGSSAAGAAVRQARRKRARSAAVE